MSTSAIEICSLSLRAALASVNEQHRTVDVVWSTGAAVERVDFAGRRYREVLSLDPAHVRLDRLNAGAPLLNSHSAFSIGDVLGVVESGSARVRGGQALATVRFSRRDDVEPVWGDVRDGIIRGVSVGYRVAKYDEQPGKDMPTRTAVDWTPYELSLVSMPADTGAHVRGDAERYRCIVETRDNGQHDEDSLADVLRRLRLLEADRRQPPELAHRSSSRRPRWYA